jgi:sarcosine oxidase subunit beta
MYHGIASLAKAATGRQGGVMAGPVDVLIIGGGLAGCAMAYFLAREGRDVLLVERHDLSTLASGSNAGSLHAQIPHQQFLLEGEAWVRGYAPVIGLLQRSIEMWKELERELAVDFEVTTPGGLLVAASQTQMRDVRRKAAIERQYGLVVEILGRNELLALAPYLSPAMAGGAFCPAEGKANPLKAAHHFAQAAERLGARLVRNTAVVSLVAEQTGFVAMTSQGELQARTIVNCAGADAAAVARMVGLDFAIEGHPIQVNVTEPVDALVKHLVYYAGEKLTLKQTRLGAFLIGGGWPARWDERTGRAVVDPQAVRDNLKAAVEVVPALAGAQLLRTWPAIVNGTADWRPVFGEAPHVRGFFTCMFPWVGFTGGPVAARLVADAVLGRPPPRAFASFFLGA